MYRSLSPFVQHCRSSGLLPIKSLRRRVGSVQRQAAGLRLRGETKTKGSNGTFGLEALLVACGGDPQGLRDAALLAVGYDAGLRVSELVAVAVEHVEPADDGTGLLLPRAKTDHMGEGAYAWLSPDSMRRIAAWLAASGIREDPLFHRVGVDRRRVDPRRKARTIEDLAYHARVDRAALAAQPPQPARVRYTMWVKGRSRGRGWRRSHPATMLRRGCWIGNADNPILRHFLDDCCRPVSLRDLKTKCREWWEYDGRNTIIRSPTLTIVARNLVPSLATES